MKIATSYFYQIRNFKPWMIPVSTCLSDPEWYRPKDGKEYYIGFSPSFEYPKTVVERVLQGEELGYMEDIFGNTAKGRKGAIGVLTSGRIYRDELEEYAVIMALTKIVSKETYNK